MNKYLLALATVLAFPSSFLWARDYEFDPGRQTVISKLASKDGISVYWLQSTSGDLRCTYQVELRNTNSYPANAIVYIDGTETIFLGRDNGLFPLSPNHSEFVCVGEKRKHPKITIVRVTKG